MAFTVTFQDAQDTPSGATMIMTIHDGSGTYPDYVAEKFWQGKTVSQVTAAMKTAAAKLDGAIIIQGIIARQKLAIIQSLAQTQFDAVVAPAMATAIATVTSQLSANGCTPAQIQTAITNAWVSLNVDGAMNNPKVTIPFSRPSLQDFNVDVSVSN